MKNWCFRSYPAIGVCFGEDSAFEKPRFRAVAGKGASQCRSREGTQQIGGSIR